MSWTTLASAEDASVNFVRPSADGGAVECRYVRRLSDYFIVYLSSHTGCRMACRFCHLTATGQTMMTPVDAEGFVEQAERVLAHYDEAAKAQGRARHVNFNWMARGEALANPAFLADAPAILARLGGLAARRGLSASYNVSSILPKDGTPPDLAAAFPGLPITFYYSLYSMDPGFRRRWLPKALPAADGLDRLARWQRASGEEVVLHWAFIAGENDRPDDVAEIREAVLDRGLRVRFNTVRYNPFSDAQGREASMEDLEARFAEMAEIAAPESRIVPRVGYDVKASCGMFVCS